MEDSGKYDYPFALDEADVQNGKTSHAKLLQMVAPGSTVLECGPAYGIMTRYLKEKLGCKVYILEVDPDCYASAIQYADSGVCADLEDDSWMSQFEDSFFDYIIYADVLEHLRDPQQVLAKMKRYLKPGGKVLLSVPNVANGCIIMNLLCDRFHYTPVGLLDDTHIHLFAREDLHTMIQRAGYYLAYESCTETQLFSNEQGDFLSQEERMRLGWILAGHSTRNIYQFVCCLTTTEAEMRSDIGPGEDITIQSEAQLFLELGTEFAQALSSREAELKDYRAKFSLINCRTQVFFDTGHGYREEESECRSHSYNEDFEFHLSVWAEVKNLRVDPADSYAIVTIKKCCALCDEGIYDLDYQTNGIQIGNAIMFDTTDPQIWFSNFKQGSKEVKIALNVVQITPDVIENYGRQYYLTKEKQRENQVLVHQHEEEKWELMCQQEELEQALADEQNRFMQMQEKFAQELEQVTQELIQYQTNYHAAIVRGEDLEQLIADIQNSFSWKITRPLYNMKTAVFFWMEKRPFTRRIRKAISILRRKGVKDLCRAMKQYCRRRKEEHQIDKLAEDQGALPDNREGYLPYDSEYQEDYDFSEYTTDVKALAFYLPQYHTFPENDMWWGKGFTEWVNVRSGDVRFAGHYQPRVPHADIGYYCLDDIQVLRQQAELAKRHGIYGFCFYYYWFSGKRLMEKPVDMLLEHPEIDLPFCLCWANENWTRAWDGQNRNVLISQEYSDRDDETFISDLRKYIDDNRYIRVNGKPLILVYNPGQIPDCHKSFEVWRRTARQIGVGEILIWTCQTANNTAALLKIEDCVDAEVEFPPHNLWMESFAVHGVDVGGKSAFMYNYQRIVDYINRKLRTNSKTGIPVHYGCMMGWDNAARRKDGWFTYYAFSLHSLYRWVLSIVERTRKDFPLEERFLFINAWNEWGEGTYLEPDEKYGYANINTVSKGLFDLPFYNDLQIIDKNSPVCEREAFERGEHSRIAVQVHIFYLDTLSDIIASLNQLPYSFDCFVSTDTEKKREEILCIMKRQCRCQKVEVKVLPNRGRDVLPFLTQMAPVLDRYDYVGHVHSKKTSTNEHGNEWREYIFDHLFGCGEYLKRLFYLFENNERIGLIMPETYPVLELQAKWGGNRDGAKMLLEKMNCNCVLPENPVFPVGNMFWARTAAVQKIFDMGLSVSDFPEETGQVNGTIAHQIERIWVYVAASAGYQYAKVFNNYPAGVKCREKKRLGVFAHYDKNEQISEDDVALIRIFSEFLSELIFVTNSDLDKKELDKIRPFVSVIKQRKNVGFDFAAWRDALLERGKTEAGKFDELVLLNNSCFPPVFDIQNMFTVMENKNLDFWGNTIFPYTPDGSYIHSDCISEHLQSYFLVFGNSVLKSDVFWSFWENVPDCKELIEVIEHCETKLTKTLSDAGFSYQPYIRETYYMSRFLNNYAIPYEKPVSLLLLKDPFIKKKCYQYMDNEERVKLEWLLSQFKKGITTGQNC